MHEMGAAGMDSKMMTKQEIQFQKMADIVSNGTHSSLLKQGQQTVSGKKDIDMENLDIIQFDAHH